MVNRPQIVPLTTTIKTTTTQMIKDKIRQNRDKFDQTSNGSDKPQILPSALCSLPSPSALQNNACSQIFYLFCVQLCDIFCTIFYMFCNNCTLFSIFLTLSTLSGISSMTLTISLRATFSTLPISLLPSNS